MKKFVTVCLILCGCVFFAFSARGDEKTQGEKVVTATMDSDGVQRVQIEGGTDYFSPNHVIVKLNVPVELKVRKVPGIVPHDIVMDSPEAGMKFKESLDPEPKPIRFTPTKTGTYPFYCDKRLWPFASHRDKGMKGVIEIVE